jgi:hypothetical protein
MEMQRKELKEQIEEGESIKNDKSEAEKAERAAKVAELKAAETLRIEELAAAARSKKSRADDDWISRSRSVHFYVILGSGYSSSLQPFLYCECP